MLILLHTSKTMHRLGDDYACHDVPALINQSQELITYLRSLTVDELANCMAISKKLAANVATQYAEWSAKGGTTAIHTFAGDIYSGLQIQTWDQKDLEYANKNLRILSGLYGVLRPLDAIQPYRLELGYRLPNPKFRNLYNYWGDQAGKILPKSDTVIDLTAKEYSKLVTPFMPDTTFVCPKFMTISPKTGEPVFVVVHAKIARGAFARWLIQNQIDKVEQLPNFADLGYRYDAQLSTPEQPVYICTEFGGLGLSVRLQHK